MRINITRQHGVTDSTGARRTFGLGERDLADDLAQQLIAARAGEQVASESAPAGSIKHLGGGWFLLPDGSKIKGKAAALAAAG